MKKNSVKINKLEAGSLPKSLIAVWEDIKIMFSLISDYTKGNYREIPWLSIASIIAAILYFVSPIDIIPDFIPIAGYLDDAAVITICMRWVKVDIEKYKEWRDSDSK